MNKDLLQSIVDRRSCKRFSDRKISEDELQLVLTAGMMAPTGRGSQSPTMVVVQDPDKLSLLSHLNREILGSDSDPFYGAPTVVVVLGDPSHPTWLEDGTLVMGNLMNAAAAIGLGSCWIHRAKETFLREEGKSLLKEWNLPDSLIGIGYCALGYPATDWQPKPRQSRKERYIIRS